MPTKTARRDEFPKAVRDALFDQAHAGHTRCGEARFRCAGCARLFPRAKTQVDHIVECADGGTSEADNGQILCLRCHARKTDRNRRRRARAERLRSAPRTLARLVLGGGLAVYGGARLAGADRLTTQLERWVILLAAVVLVLAVAWQARRLLPWAWADPDRVEPAPPPAPVKPHPLEQRIVAGAREILGDKGAADLLLHLGADGELEWFELGYADTHFPDHSDDARAALHAKLTAKIGGRWKATWRTQRDVVRFTRRPLMPAHVPHPGLHRGRPWHVLPIGVDGEGTEASFDLMVTSHLLIIGATNAGKTSLMRGLIAALADSAKRGQVELELLDPKRVELTGFRDWPGVRGVATSAEALWETPIRVLAEMDERYRLHDEDGVPLDSHRPLVMVLDEYREYVKRMRVHAVSIGEKPTQDRPPTALAAVDSLLAMGRKARVFVVLGTQRPDAKWFGGDARDNAQGRAGVGALTAEASRMAFGTGDYGRDVPASAKGRTTVQVGDGEPVEVQAYWTPEPGDQQLGDADMTILNRLRGNAA